jgi:Ca2+-binding RTX toxin-like protein
MAILVYKGPIVKFPILGLYIEGTDGNDSLYGTSGADSIHGLGGNDFLSGGAGNDLLDGGIGDDVLDGGAGADTFIGGAGVDTVSYGSATIGVMVDMATGGITNDAQGDTYSGIEVVRGSNFGDILNGDANANTFFGHGGDDWLFGQGGNDSLNGGEGDDQIRGGAGSDVLSGNKGSDTLTGDDAGQFFADTFVLRNEPGPDTITDFQVGLDKVSLQGFGSTPFGFDGQLAHGGGYVGEEFYFGGIDAGDKLVYNSANHTLYQVALAWDSDEGAFYITQSTEIARFSNGVDLHASDFLIA